jgi:hypothetical protein
MDLQLLANLGDAIGGLGVVVSLLYLAIQIRQNTKAVRSSSYHQAAEQTWNYCLAVAQDESLAEILARRMAGGDLTPAEQMRANISDQALIYGFENMLRLQEQGLVDSEIWQNFMANSMQGLSSDHIRGLLASRPGPLSKRLLAIIEASSKPG